MYPLATKTRQYLLLGAFLLLMARGQADTVKVLAFAKADSNKSPAGEVAVLNRLGGITATATNLASSLSFTNLPNYQIVYAASLFENGLDSKATELQYFLFFGGGVVIGQANVDGPMGWLPTELSVKTSAAVPTSGGVHKLTTAGAAHPIFKDRKATDLGARPADTIRLTDLGPGWTVLATYTVNGNTFLAMAVGQFGSGNLILWPDRYDSNIDANPSDALIRQVYLFASVPAVTNATVSGTLTFVDLVPSAPNPSVAFTFRPSDGSGNFTRTLSLPPTGEFQITDVPKKSYVLHIKGSNYLAKNVNIDTTTGDWAGVKASLLPGDANDDNHIDIFDLAALAEAFNSQEGEARYNAQTDFNGNREVSIFDLAILAENFNTDGDP